MPRPRPETCEHGTRQDLATVFCTECLYDFQRSRSRGASAVGNTSIPAPDLVTRLVGVDNLGHDSHSGSHSHAHLSHGGPDSDGDGIHAHLHTHSGHAGHDHVHPPGMEDSIYAESVKAAAPTESGGRNPSSYGLARQDPALFLLPSGLDLNEQLTAAENLVEQTAKDWEAVCREVEIARAAVPMFELSHARSLSPAERHAWTQAMLLEGRAQQADLAYQRAVSLYRRLQRQWDDIGKPYMNAPPGPGPGPDEEIIAIRGNRSLGISTSPVSGRVRDPEDDEPVRGFVVPRGPVAERPPGLDEPTRGFIRGERER